jgi:uncharacterized metal-binding protein YceD (DUF177 family)
MMKPTDLQLNAHEIPNAGLKLDGDLPIEWAEPSMLPAYRAVSPVSIKAEVQPVGDNLLVRGEARLGLEFECSRTLETARTELVVPFAELFVPGTRHHLKLVDEDVSSDDLVDEPWVIEDGKVDLEALIREHIVLAQDPYPVASGTPRPAGAETDTPLWSSALDGVDPRWERLKNLKLD